MGPDRNGWVGFAEPPPATEAPPELGRTAEKLIRRRRLENPKEEITARDIGRMGGNATKQRHGREHFVEMGRRAAQVLKEKYGREHYSKMAQSRGAAKAKPEPEPTTSITAAEAGRKGGTIVKEKYGHDHFVSAGRRGGSTTKQKYGPEHYARIGRMGGMTKAKNREANATDGADTPTNGHDAS
jgi:hypothetical protein